MTDDKLMSKLANVPLAKPGFEALGMSAPFIVQMNPQGKWENSEPENLEEEGLRAVIRHIVNSKAIDAAQSYCCQCAAENKTSGMQPQYVPVVMMPIYPSDKCPFDMECEVQKLREAERTKTKPIKKTKMTSEAKEEEDKDKDRIKKTKKRGYQMQRLTDFDLLSQW